MALDIGYRPNVCRAGSICSLRHYERSFLKPGSIRRVIRVLSRWLAATRGESPGSLRTLNKRVSLGMLTPRILISEYG